MVFFVLLFLLLVVFLVRYNFFRLPKRGILVLLYHRVDDRPTGTSLDKFSLPLSRFEWQISYLKKKGFISITPDEIDKIKEEKLYLKNNYVLITFDDGYKDNVDAARILKKYGMKGLFFISTSLIGKEHENAKMMDETDLKELVDLGMALGSHSHRHLKLSQLRKEEVKNEIMRSIDILSSYQEIEDFAYPFGNFNDDVIDVLRELKIKRGYVIAQKIYQPNIQPIFKIPRAIVRKDTNKIDFYLIITRGRSKF
ncbi:polysaccharide deacetylase family protein [Hippea maritima]|uniref:Polysaccharide deacetylase n=1 Tax=Hippea maritima (strain ATCC 700847 / DSM 10411 / MH2) TaxID=760142 RepID=F2LWT6_HIPMA|nr:polysaccharide deacetylase family protein [Hippea maritima]AEA33064.1 polysaccharide deacetylase [Hippea maritima DSM 10411]